MSTVERLLKATEDIWAGYHEKPFVQGLRDGTLDVEKFRRYIIQDYWYLMDYTKVFAVGVAKSKSVEVMKLFAKYIQAILDGEVNVHNGYMAGPHAHRPGQPLLHLLHAQRGLQGRRGGGADGHLLLRVQL